MNTIKEAMLLLHMVFLREMLQSELKKKGFKMLKDCWMHTMAGENQVTVMQAEDIFPCCENTMVLKLLYFCLKGTL